MAMVFVHLEGIIGRAGRRRKEEREIDEDTRLMLRAATCSQCHVLVLAQRVTRPISYNISHRNYITRAYYTPNP